MFTFLKFYTPSCKPDIYAFVIRCPACHSHEFIRKDDRNKLRDIVDSLEQREMVVWQSLSYTDPY